MKMTSSLIVAALVYTTVQAGLAQDKPATPGGGWERLTMQPFQDAQGMTILEMPLPSTWKVINGAKPGEPGITGPDGIKMFYFPGRNFVYSNDPQMQQIHARSGQPMRPAPPVAQLIQQDLVPWCATLGLKYIKHAEIPELTKIDQWYSDQLYKAMPSKNKTVAIGSDWENANGEPHFIIMHLNVGVSAQMQTWGYYCKGLQAEKKVFDKAKQQLIFALANARYNPQQIMAYNQREAQKAGQSWAEHNARMAKNQAAFEASQRAHVNKSNAINEAIMSGWRERNAASASIPSTKKPTSWIPHPASTTKWTAAPIITG
ncbi:MAG: hypothetical protein MUF13_11800 [Akkermansiaceae bacterium]|nr:hypothetical protein [Akkermansiaceae bacterium]